MDRLASRVSYVPLALGVLASTLGPARAQTLQTLHVRSFEMTADRTSVRVGEPFHLTLSARVDEALLEIDNVTLPDFSVFDVLGDERRCASTARGSDCSETLTLQATAPGDRTLGPATMDAVDARNRKPSRFSTNAVKVHVAGVSAAAANVSATVFEALRIVLVVLLVGIAAAAMVWAFGRRRVFAALPAPAPPPEPGPEPQDSVATLARALAREPTRARVFALRDALRAGAHAREEETLGDLIARGAVRDPRERAALGALERAAFCEDTLVVEAVREALPFLSY